MASKSTETLEQDARSNSKKDVRATVTGVDSDGKLFRDNARVISLKDRKCIYHSTVKHARDSSVRVELKIGPESWRSDAKVKSVSPAGQERDGFRVTVELDRAHGAVIEAAEDESLPSAKAPAAEARNSSDADAPAIPEEMPAPPAPDISPPPAALSEDMIADIVRPLLAAEAAQRKREIQDLVDRQLESSLRQPLAALEAKLLEQLQHLQKQPALTQETVQKIAAKAAENAQIEWATTSQKIVAEAVRSTLAAQAAEQQREIRGMVAGEIEAAWRGPLATRIDAKLEKAIDAKLEEYSRKRPAAITETTVRQLATQVAEGIQLQWASTKLQKMVAEAVSSAIAAEKSQRQEEISAAVSSQVEEALRGSLSGQLDAAVEKALAANIEQYFKMPSVTEVWKELVAEAVRQPLTAEYEQRARQVKAVVSSEIASAVRGPIAAQMDEMLQRALEAQRAEYARTPPAITENAIREIVTGIAQHPQFQDALDSLAASLTERWTEIARGATASAQQDMNARIAATERLASQVILDIQHRLTSFGTEMNQVLGVPEIPASSDDASGRTEEPERDKRFRELLQSTGAHFEREMKAALQKIFGRS